MPVIKITMKLMTFAYRMTHEARGAGKWPAVKSVCRNAFAVALLASPFALCAQTNTFPSSGSVGIGTTAPQANLDVRGDRIRFFEPPSTSVWMVV